MMVVMALVVVMVAAGAVHNLGSEWCSWSQTSSGPSGRGLGCLWEVVCARIVTLCDMREVESLGVESFWGACVD